MKKSKKVNLWLLGGFGNVLFQLFFARLLNNSNYKVILIDNLTSKNFLTRLIGWKIHDKTYMSFTTNYEIKKKFFLTSIFTILIAKIFYKLKIKNRISLFYNNDYFENIYYSKNMFGYFQNKNFLSRNKKFLNDFCSDIKCNLKKDNNYDVVVHYRMSDSGWANISELYYKEIKKLIIDEKKKPLIVTDDIKKAKFFFSDVNVVFSKNKNPLDDFNLMVCSKKLYCSPSTFSWWASHMVSDSTEIIFPKFLYDNLGYHGNFSNVKII